MSKLLGLQGNKITKLITDVSPNEDWAAATTLEARGLLRRNHRGFYATVRGLEAVENMLGSVAYAPIG